MDPAPNPASNPSTAAPPRDALARLEQLDDVVFPAIAGDEHALERLGPTWREAVETLGVDAVRESRNEYLRYARETWDFLRRHSVEQPHRLAGVLQIIALLSGIDM